MCKEVQMCQNDEKTGENGLRGGWDGSSDFRSAQLCDLPVISLYHMPPREPPKTVRSVSTKFPELLGWGDAPRVY